MAFLHIALLAGAGLIAVPIVLHLIMRQRPRLLEFPALRFIAQRRDMNRRRLRLRHLLLLALRCAVICLLALALARPSLQATGMLGDQEAPVAAAMIFDTQPHMQYRQRDQTRIQAAQETALWLLGQLPADSEVAVLDSRSTSAVFSADLGSARQRIERLDASAVALPLGGVVEDALRLVSESTKDRKEVYIFTDLAQSSWSGDSTRTLEKKLQDLRDVGIYVIDVGVKEPQNFALGDLRLSGQVLSKNVPLRLQVDLAHQGPEDDRTVELYLVESNDKHINRGQDTNRLPADQSKALEFRLGSLTSGLHQGYVKIAGEDGLAADDVRYFTVEVKPAWRVLLAAPTTADPQNPGQRRTPDDYAQMLFEALAPYDFRTKGQAAFSCDVVDLKELPKHKLDEYQAVCVLDPPPLPAETWVQLNGFATAGGGVAIFLGRNARLESFNTPPAQELLAGQLVRQFSAPSGDVYLAPTALEHPILAKFRSQETSIPWDGSPVFRHWQLGPLAKGAAVILPYSNNLPALIERPVGNGRVLTMTTSASEEVNRPDTWNALSADWPFFMLANETLLYLVGGSDARLNYLAGQRAVLHFDPGQSHAIFSLLTPRGDQIRQSANEKQNALEFDATDTPGNYQARAGGEEGTELGFSVNLSAEACRLDRISDDRLRAIFGNAPFRLAHNREEIDRSISMGRVGQELYPYLIVLVALLLACELVLSNRFYRRDDGAQPGVRSEKSFQAAIRGFGESADARSASTPAKTPVGTR